MPRLQTAGPAPDVTAVNSGGAVLPKPVSWTLLPPKRTLASTRRMAERLYYTDPALLAFDAEVVDGAASVGVMAEGGGNAASNEP